MTPNTRILLASLALVAGMVGLVAASVPLYSLFCRVTGAGGTPRLAAGPSEQADGGVITIRFDAAVMKDIPWRFAPEQRSMTVHLGENSLALFSATNRSDGPLTGTAVFNVTPAKAGPYVNKVQCFCFSEQRLAAGETAEMPVSFFIDPAIARDPETSDVHTITLSYTFYKARGQDPAGSRTGAAAGGPANRS